MSSVEKAGLEQWRKELVPQVRGSVLEVGAGTGANLLYYPKKVIQLVLSEPDAGMRKQMKAKIANGNFGQVIVSSGTAEKIEAKDASFDFVVSSLVFCSVPSLDTALLEVKRVLKKGGRFIFLEHVAAEKGSERRRWQNRINPLWRKIAGNCHLNRDTEKAILEAGFTISEVRHEHLHTIMPVVKPTIRGVAVKP